MNLDLISWVEFHEQGASSVYVGEHDVKPLRLDSGGNRDHLDLHGAANERAPSSPLAPHLRILLHAPRPAVYNDGPLEIALLRSR